MLCQKKCWLECRLALVWNAAPSAHCCDDSPALSPPCDSDKDLVLHQGSETGKLSLPLYNDMSEQEAGGGWSGLAEDGGEQHVQHHGGRSLDAILWSPGDGAVGWRDREVEAGDCRHTEVCRRHQQPEFKDLFFKRTFPPFLLHTLFHRSAERTLLLAANVHGVSLTCQVWTSSKLPTYLPARNVFVVHPTLPPAADLVPVVDVPSPHWTVTLTWFPS